MIQHKLARNYLRGKFSFVDQKISVLKSDNFSLKKLCNQQTSWFVVTRNLNT